MVYEVIGKLTLYVIGTWLFGSLIYLLDDGEHNWSIFFGAWVAGIAVFFWN